jgi:hypothetical protein
LGGDGNQLGDAGADRIAEQNKSLTLSVGQEDSLLGHALPQHLVIGPE